MTKQISITIEEEHLKYLDELAITNKRSRSGMIGWILQMAMENDAQEEDN